MYYEKLVVRWFGAFFSDHFFFSTNWRQKWKMIITCSTWMGNKNTCGRNWNKEEYTNSFMYYILHISGQEKVLQNSWTSPFVTFTENGGSISCIGLWSFRSCKQTSLLNSQKSFQFLSRNDMLWRKPVNLCILSSHVPLLSFSELQIWIR